MKRLMALMLLGTFSLWGCGQDEQPAQTNESIPAEETEEVTQEETQEVTEGMLMMSELADLLETDLVFDTGSYIKGDVPKGIYAFVSLSSKSAYYSEEDENGDIIENQNFDSFGYVEVHERGNLQTRGVLVHLDALSGLGVSGAKELYETLNDLDGYNGSGYYWIGKDIPSGEYIFETSDSSSSAYVALMSGPVGNSDIIKNSNFDGRYSLVGNDGEFLEVSRASIEIQ